MTRSVTTFPIRYNSQPQANRPIQFLEYFFTPSDAKFLASLGLNCIRIPINYRYFIDPLSPSVIKPDGFRLLDRIVGACAAEGLYTIIDMHTFPGGQNQGWHADSGIHKALFWEFKDLQDRMVNLWVEIGKHYAGNTWVSLPFLTPTSTIKRPSKDSNPD